MQNPEEIAVPLIVFTTIISLVWLLLWYGLTKKREFLKFLEKQSDISPESIEALGKHYFSPRNERRRGIFLILLAVAFWGFSVVVEFPDRGNLNLNQAINGVGLFPFLSGIAFLIVDWLER